MKNLTFSMLTMATLFGVLILACCKKEKLCSAGTGGGLTFVIKLFHHGALIPNDSLRPDTVWLKFNTQDWSGAPAGADAQFIGNYPEDHIHVNGLQCGDYYLFASGWDTSISDTVRGGRPFTTNQTSGEVQLDIAVTE